MFSTILTEVTGYFDRRALVSAFFPSLVFWSLAIVIILAMELGVGTAFKIWENLSATLQGFLLITFFLWISFWTFLTLNFRTALVRMFEGYWPDEGKSAWLYKWKRGQCQALWDKLDERDTKLGETEVALISEINDYSELRHTLENARIETTGASSKNAEQVSKELGTFLDATELKLKEPATGHLSTEELVKMSNRVRERWLHILPYLKDRTFLFSWKEIPGNDVVRLTDFLKSNYDVDWIKTAKLAKTDKDRTIKITAGKNVLSLNLYNENTELNLIIDNDKMDKFIVKTEIGKLNIYGRPIDKEIWIKHNEHLLKITTQLEKIVKRRMGEIEEQRLRLNHDLFLYYPPNRDDIMPTRLGNVLKSAEMYSQERYHLDAVSIWPRLQPALPKDFADPLEDAKTSLDLMVTLSAFIMLFCLPLSAWLAVKSSVQFPFWIPLILAVTAFLLRFYVPASFAIAAFVLIYFPANIQSVSIVIAKIQIFLTLSAGVLLLALIAYQNAIQAGIAYGEKIKAAFDLYRWKVLEGLHLQLPKDFEKEQKIWEEVCGLLQRGYKPDPQYYRYILPSGNKETPK
jgi:hypothetical protein